MHYAYKIVMRMENVVCRVEKPVCVIPDEVIINYFKYAVFQKLLHLYCLKLVFLYFKGSVNKLLLHRICDVEFAVESLFKRLNCPQKSGYIKTYHRTRVKNKRFHENSPLAVFILLETLTFSANLSESVVCPT